MTGYQPIDLGPQEVGGEQAPPRGYRLSAFSERATIICEDLEREHCVRCGRAMVRTVEPDGMYHPESGEPTVMIWHSCPMWLPAPRTLWWYLTWPLRWGIPRAMGHDSHSERNPLIARGYR